MSTSTAARRIEALEAALGRTLVHRTSAGTSVEPDALELVSLAEQLELGLQTARRDAGEDVLSGSVRLSMGEGFLRSATKLLCDLRLKHPGLRLELVSEARFADLARREADIGIRTAKSSSPVLIERSVGKLRFALYASQSYVERRLRVGRLDASDFERHDFVGYEGALLHTPNAQWLQAQGAKRFPFRSSSDFAIEEAVLQGQGICLMAEAHGRTLPRLVRLDFDAALPALPVFVVFHKELRNVPRYRLVTSALETALRKGLA